MDSGSCGIERKADYPTVVLDEEFKLGLNTLRPFILGLSSVEDAKLTRLWLEKLHDSLDERELRNRFLRELTQQVQAGKLRFPFDKPPPLAPLAFCQDGGGEVVSSDICAERWKFPNSGRESATTTKKASINYIPQVFGKSRNITEVLAADGRPNGRSNLRQRRAKSWTRLLRSHPPVKRHRGRRGTSSKSRDSFEDVHCLRTTISSLQTRNEALAQEVKMYQETAIKTQRNLGSVQQEVALLRNKLDEMRALHTCIEESNSNVVNDYRKALTESVKRLSERLDVVSKRNANLEEKIERLKWEKKTEQQPSNLSSSEVNATIKNLKRDLDEERNKRIRETQVLEKRLTQKELQLSQLDSHVQHQCDKMQKEVISMQNEIDRKDQPAIGPPRKFKEKISGLRKHVRHVEKTNKKILGIFERKLNHYKEESDRKLDILRREVEAKDRLASSLQLALRKAEAQYKKHIMELQESCKAQRAFDHQRIAALQERLRNRLLD